MRLLIRQANYTVEGKEALEKYLKKRSGKHAERAAAAEKQADEMRCILIDELNRTLGTNPKVCS